RVYKEPSTIFLIPGIIPFVPGGLAYDATSSIILSDYTGAVNIIMEVIISAGSIAAGILFAEQFALLFIKKKTCIFHEKKITRSLIMEIRNYQASDERGWVRCRVLSFLD